MGAEERDDASADADDADDSSSRAAANAEVSAFADLSFFAISRRESTGRGGTVEVLVSDDVVRFVRAACD